MGPGAAWFVAFSVMQTPAPQADLSLVLSCGEKSGEVALSIRNAGPTDTAVLMGLSLANGRWYVPRELVVELKRNGNPEWEELVYRGPSDVAGGLITGS